jgi:hypothetical protein
LSNPSDRTSENLNILYQDLKRQYDLILDRRKTLSSQATGLMGFAAIIETVLVGLMIAFTTNKDVQILLKNSEYYSLVVIFVGIGFFSYIIAALLCLLAFVEPMWFPIPMYGGSRGKLKEVEALEKYEAKYDEFIQHPEQYKLKMIAGQIVTANWHHQKTNNRKYKLLKYALASLIIGIIFTALVGFTLLGIAT